MKRAIAHIPSAEMLRLKPVEYWLGRFPDFVRRSATEIVLPAVGTFGPSFESEVHPIPPALRGHELLPDWVRQARDLLGDEGAIWANIIIDGQFLDNSAIWQKNQYDQEFAQVCITHPTVQRILHQMISEILEHGVDGVVLDLTDAYPNSGSDSYAGLSAHCFCAYCMDAMRLKGFRESKDAFIGDDSILRLALRVEDDGTAYVDTPQSWIDHRNADALVSLALARRIVSGDSQQLTAEAMRLLAYLRARVQVTAEAVRAVLAPCRDKGKRTAVILGSADCDWSSMVTLEALHTAKSASEYWLPDSPDPQLVAAGEQIVQFLATRSTYGFNRFFETVEDADKRIVLFGIDEFLKNLMSTSKRLMGNKLSAGAAYVVEHLPEFAGFVGIPLGQQDHLDIVEQLTHSVTGVVLPQELLMKFRIVEPSP
ncbi:hypothetical protein ACPFP2_08150 [Micromonospora citrea]|uniref:hypothetical protein n=1 Tax=Micromonospora citrea TaxID=47855 RepID=UPI003C4CDDDA